MIKNGQTPADIVTLAFANATKAGFDFEAIDLSELIDRIGADHFSRPHRLTFYQILSLQGAEAIEEIDFVPYPLVPGQISFLRPGQVQRLSLPAHCRGRLFLFAPSFISGSVQRIAPVVESTPFIDGALDALVHEYAGAASREILFHELMAALLRLERQSAPPEGVRTIASADFRRLAHLFEQLLESTFAENRSVAVLAQRLGSTEKTLNRACLAAFGVPPKTVIQQRVVLEAKRILAHTDIPVKAIAAQLGFTEPTNFIKFFHRITGELPVAFRARVQNGLTQTVIRPKSSIHEPQLT